MKNSNPPVRLSSEAKALWRRLTSEYGIDDGGGRAILLVACEALDRMRQAQKAIAADGAVVIDRFGQKKAHPLLTTERDSRSAHLMALKHLGLDIEPTKERPAWRR